MCSGMFAVTEDVVTWMDHEKEPQRHTATLNSLSAPSLTHPVIITHLSYINKD